MHEDVQAITQCLAGRSDAFEHLVRRYQNAAYAIVLGYTGNRHDAENLVQDAFLTAYLKLGQLEKPAAFAGWLRTIVTNQCRNWLRRQKVVQGQTPLENATPALREAADDQYHSEDRARELWDAVERLPKKYRTLIRLHYLSGLPYQDIGAFLEMPVGLVKSRIHQARNLLKTMLTTPIETVESHQEDKQVNTIDVVDDVQEDVCRIATAPIHEMISLGDTHHIVLFCGVPTDLTVQPADGPDMVLDGMRLSIGASDEQAKANAEGIQVKTDQVDDYRDAGPHYGEISYGVSSNNKGERWLNIRTTQDHWRHLSAPNPYWPFDNDIGLDDIFPVLKEEAHPIPDVMLGRFGKAMRVSIVQDDLPLIEVPSEQYTARIQDYFLPNTTNEDFACGAPGRTALNVQIPPGASLTIIKGEQVRVKNLDATVQVIDATDTDLSGIRGDAAVYNNYGSCPTRIRARHIFGHMLLRTLPYSGANTTPEVIRRTSRLKCTLEGIMGGADIEVSLADIKASDLGGDVRIFNRYGVTKLYQEIVEDDSRYRLITGSGKIDVFLDDPLLDQVGITIMTLCGVIHRQALYDRVNHFGSISKVMTYSTEYDWEDKMDAHFFLQSESGEMSVDNM